MNRNPIPPTMREDIKFVVGRFRRAPHYNLPAAAMMELAYDLHAHGSPNEAKMAESIIAGTAKGLGSKLEENPVCPGCGRRHPQLKDGKKLAEGMAKFLSVVFGVSVE